MNCLSTVVAFCVLHNFAFGSNEDYTNENPTLNDKQRQYEENAGSKADLMENKHYYYPNYYKDLNRRFVPQYPYEEIEEIKNTVNGKANDALAYLKELLQAAQTISKTDNNEDAKLIPVRAPPELVLAVARESAKLKNPKPSYPTEEALRNSALRSGDYWNGVWKEDVDPVQHLRTGHEKTPVSRSVKAKVMPGSKLYDLVSALQKMSPRLLYIINDNNKNK